jgi:hypothetical protein
MNAKKPDKRPKIQPVYLVARKLIDPDTGEVVGALVAASPWDAKRLREMKLGADQIRAELKKPRNVKFHRLAHALGNLLAEHAPQFAGLSGHSALKEAQKLAGVCCDILEIDLGPFGKVPVKVAKSIAFDSMSEYDFGELFVGVTRWLDENVAPGLAEDIKAEYWQMTGEKG